MKYYVLNKRMNKCVYGLLLGKEFESHEHDYGEFMTTDINTAFRYRVALEESCYYMDAPFIVEEKVS
jgi:hypothetical protein